MKITKMELVWHWTTFEYCTRDYMINWDNGDKGLAIIHKNLLKDPKCYSVEYSKYKNDLNRVVDTINTFDGELSWDTVVELVKTTLENSTSIL